MRRRLLYLVAATLALSVIVGTGGFSAVSADRGVDVAVVPDEHAYLGIETVSTEATVGESVDVLRLRDNFASDVDLEAVHLVDSSVPADLEGPTGSAPLDDAASVSVSCDGVGEGELTFEITAEGTSAEVVATRTIPFSCTPSPIEPSDVTFIGCGNARIAGHASQFPLEVTLFGYHGGGVTSTTATVTGSGGVTGGAGGQMIGLEIRGGTFVTNPNVDFAGGDCGGAADGNPATGVPGDPREQLGS